jgi:alpha-amylase
MTDISLCFEVHQPIRLKKNFFWDGLPLKRVPSGALLDHYFDEGENRRIFERISTKCYLPANRIILEELRRLSEEERPFKVAYSLSGIFLEQCRLHQPEVLDSFVRLVETGMVEVMEQTYYHSLSSLYEGKEEFLEQVRMHRELVWDIFGAKPTTFENTELLYNDEIARTVEAMGYRGIFAEGVIADPGRVYRPAGAEISVLLRNYQLTDDVGFRFSSRSWEEHPLTAEKYSAWLAASPGQCINIFCDYETFGEHHWPETGILEFLRFLPREVLKWQNLRFKTPAEIIRDISPSGEISVPRTVSWADLERDTSCWLGNTLQWACYLYEKRLEAPVKESQDPELLKVWRCLGLSDHLYYIFTWGGGPGEVHSYFSPYGNAYDAAVTYFSVLSDLHFRLKERLTLADQPFRFSVKDELTGEEAWSLEGLHRALAGVEIPCLEHHNDEGDFAAWARMSLGDERLAGKLEELGDLRGERLRKRLLKAAKSSLPRRHEGGRDPA